MHLQNSEDSLIIGLHIVIYLLPASIWISTRVNKA